MANKIIRYFRSLFTTKQSLPGVSMRSIELTEYRVSQYMRERRPYLQPGYTIRELSDDLRISTQHLSVFLALKTGMTFHDYINQYRIRYCEEILRLPNMTQISVQELAGRCGFYNKVTFTTAFEKFTGYSVADYSRHFLHH